jgi:hypothetical protein
MRRRVIFLLACVLLLLVFVCQFAAAQVTQATITGQIGRAHV